MLFFQTVLFGGYLYAHLLQRWGSLRAQTVVHLALIAAAVAVLPIAPSASWKPTDSIPVEPGKGWLLIARDTL